MVAKEGLGFGFKGRSLTLWQRRVFGLVAKEGLWFSCRGGSLIWLQSRDFGLGAEKGLWFGCRGVLRMSTVLYTSKKLKWNDYLKN